jgi:hypothetical protein
MWREPAYRLTPSCSVLMRPFARSDSERIRNAHAGSGIWRDRILSGKSGCHRCLPHAPGATVQGHAPGRRPPSRGTSSSDRCFAPASSFRAFGIGEAMVPSRQRPSKLHPYRRVAPRAFHRFPNAHVAGLDGLSDPEVLRLAKDQGRILISHDENSMPRHFSDFLTNGNSSPGVLMVPQGTPVDPGY